MTSTAPLPGLQAKLAYAGRKFHAWWEGYAFDEAVERAALRTKYSPIGADPQDVEEWIAAAIWGGGRLEPGGPAWTLRFARLLSLPTRARVILFGAGAGGPLRDLKKGARWRVTGFTRAKHAAQKDLRSYDAALQRLDKAAAAGAISFFDLHRDASPGAFANFAATLLAPRARAVFVDYAVARKGVRLRSCFPARKHGAPKAEAEYREAIKNAGFSVDDVSDETAAFLPLIAQGWAQWRRAYDQVNRMPDARQRAAMMRALADQARLWADRFEAMKSGQLRVICLRATKK